MKKIDWPSVDGDLLHTFLLVFETRSTTEAAKRLFKSQSSVSHALARLRDFFEDPLFVRSGQKLIPTDQAEKLRDPIQEIVLALQNLNRQQDFDPKNSHLDFVVAANDFQRDIIFPQLMRELISEGITANFEFIASGHPSTELMRSAQCDIAVTPFPPKSSDTLQRQLFEARMMCFFDGTVREAPSTWKEYCNADHITVKFADGGRSRRALTGLDTSGIPSAKVTVQDFAAITSFVKGTRMIATELDLMKLCTLKDLDVAPLPQVSDPVRMFMTWHRRSDQQPAHIWLRSRIEKIAREARKQF